MLRPRTLLLRFVIPSICAGLGTWQVQRHRQKRALLDETEALMRSDARPLTSLQQLTPTRLERGQKWTLHLTRTTPGERVLVGPRGVSAGLSPDGYAFLLFERAMLDSGESVIVNRGHLPRPASDSPLPPLLDRVVVVTDREERRPLLGASNSPGRILWKNWSDISLALGFSSPPPVVFRAVATAEHGEHDGPLRLHRLSTADIPNRHLEYIATWYSIAVLTAAMSFLRK